MRNIFQVQHREQNTAGQAIIEFALLISVIILLLAAAVDLGNAYRTYQTLVNASAEAATYIAHNPLANCAVPETVCPGGSPAAGADRQARVRFRNEQGSVIRGVASTLDLDNNGKDDVTEHGWAFVDGRVRIQMADSTQVQIDNPKSLGIFFNGTTNADCIARKRFDAADNACFVVVQAKIIYRPMILSTILGREMTIHAMALKPIVQGD